MNLKENQELMEKMKKSGSFSTKMNQISQKFKEFQQIALYSEAHPLSKDMVVTIRREETTKWQGKTSQPTNLHIILGMKQPNGPKSIEKILLNIINKIPRYRITNLDLDNLIQYCISTAFTDFKKILEFLPIQYFQHLQKIYVLQGNLKNKGSYWMSFDYITNYLKNKTAQLNNYKQLIEKIGVDREALLQVLPEEIVAELGNNDQFVRQILEIKSVNANIIFNSNVYDPLKGNYIQKKPLLMTSGIKARTIKTLQQYEVGQTGAPLIIELLISYFNGKQELLNAEGLFRKSVAVDEETTLLKELYSENYDYLETITDPHLIANGLKRFLTNIAQPIIPYQSFNIIMEVSDEKLKQCVFEVVSSLKNNRKMTILILIDFLKEKMLPRSQSNKMTQNNLAIILGPCLMHSEVPSMKDLIFTKKSINAAVIIFRDFEKIFGNSHKRSAIIRKSIQTQGRQTFKGRLQNLTEPLSVQKEEVTGKKQENQQEITKANNLLSGIFEIMKQQINELQKIENQENLDFEKEILYQSQPNLQK